MPTTPGLALPYPALTDGPDGPLQIRQLAEKVETEFYNQPRAKAQNLVDLNVANAALTDLDLGSIVYDWSTSSMVDLAANTLIIKRAGWYRFSARVPFAADPDGYRAVLLTKGAADFQWDDYRSATPTQATVVQFTTEEILCAVNDAFKIQVLHTAGAALLVGTLVNGRRATFSANYVRKG